MTSQTAHFPLTLPIRILLLGSGELGKELTISLQRLGCHVIACDTYQNAPAMSVAAQSVVIDMTDADAVTTLINETQPDLIVPEVEKLAIGALTQAAQDGIRVAPSAKIVQLTFDRQGIRTLAAEKAGVPTSSYAFADSLEPLQEAAKTIGFPCFIKPTMSSSGHGQSRIRDASELETAWNEACSGARANTGRVIIEGQIDFDYEITLLTVRHLDGDQVVTSFCAPIGHCQENGDYVESWQPQEMSPLAAERAKAIAKAVTDTLAEESAHENYPVLGIFGVELFIKGDDVFFSELSPRPHDTGLVTLASQTQSEFDLHARAILGLPIDTTLQTPAASAPLKAPTAVETPRYHGVAEALADPSVTVRIFGKPHAHPGRRMAVAAAQAQDVATAREIARAAIGKIKIESE
ncbi:formate-dependent phosphoribosylglycinamide formyltransferase [Arcanobacterium bovis]|uniref:Formate-dependent phosphoribosylglycinamide formyltransferase n=1 Tax=Arcanobacterium bovis TaxID=2529275 RepID=A0A4Q9V0Y8_9ACTO|nr:formate-dependent phosphoribosylglycinamide formyltransferase [Arcanobacterium bovis]TBW21407.1 formate-dependent phosphoribosylglycinamide formyltransferase [Arcanobacterium bovis]